MEQMNLSAVLGGDPVYPLPEGEHIPRRLRASAEEHRVVSDVLAGGLLGLGPWNGNAAERFQQHFGIPHVVLTDNGSHPITLGLWALGVGEGDLAYTPASTFQATAGGCYLAKVVPVMAEVKPLNLTIDPQWLREDIARRKELGLPLPKVIFAVALYHQVPDMKALRRIADENGMHLILDFAHGPYAEIDGRPITEWADIVTYSFQQSKSLPLGEGGAIGTNDGSLLPRLRMLVSCGYIPWDLLEAEGFSKPEDGVLPAGLELPPGYRKVQSVNYRKDELGAALLWARLLRFRDLHDRAARIMPRLDAVVREHDFLTPFEPVPGVTKPCFYKWGFFCDTERFGTSVERFRRALQTEINFEVIYPYPALTIGDQRNPLLPEALRDVLSDEDYLKAVADLPEMPVAEASLHSAVMVEWAFACERGAPRILDRALAKLWRDRELIGAGA